jgi:hypothetical protein
MFVTIAVMAVAFKAIAYFPTHAKRLLVLPIYDRIGHYLPLKNALAYHGKS